MIKEKLQINRDKEVLKKCIIEIEQHCNRDLKLELNHKTQIGKTSRGIDFLGFKNILTPTSKVIRKLRSSSKIRLKKHLKTLKKLEEKKLIDEEYINIRKNAYHAHIAHSHEKRMKEILRKSKEDLK